MRMTIAGESHGKGYTGILEGLPSGFEPDMKAVAALLARRRQVYGRGERMKMESDPAEITAGLVNGKTYGGPLCLFIENRDCRKLEGEVHTPRPGHVDFSGTVKYELPDSRIAAEYGGGRITAVAAALGEVARQFLGRFGIEILGYTASVGNLGSCADESDVAALRERADRCSLRLGDGRIEAQAKALIDRCAGEGDSIGGTVRTVASGVPAGLGELAPWYEKLDAALAAAMTAIPGVKAVEFGSGAAFSQMKGSEAADEFLGGLSRKTNRAGGIEGGLSNGRNIVVGITVKAVPTIKKELSSVNLKTGEPEKAPYIRSDTCIVPAASIAAQSALSLTLLKFFLKKFGGDSLGRTEENFASYQKYLNRRFQEKAGRRIF